MTAVGVSNRNQHSHIHGQHPKSEFSTSITAHLPDETNAAHAVQCRARVQHRVQQFVWADLLGFVICPHANGCVGGQLLDAVGQLGPYTLQCAAVCLVASVTGIHLHRSEPQLPEIHYNVAWHGCIGCFCAGKSDWLCLLYRRHNCKGWHAVQAMMQTVALGGLTQDMALQQHVDVMLQGGLPQQDRCM